MKTCNSLYQYGVGVYSNKHFMITSKEETRYDYKLNTDGTEIIVIKDHELIGPSILFWWEHLE